MSIGQGLTFSSIVLQSAGKVLYGTFLIGVSTPLFILLSISMTAAVFLISVGFRMPKEGRGLLVFANISTAIGFITAFFALKHLPPAIFAAIEIGMSLLTAIALTCVLSRAWPRMIRILACVGIVTGCALLSWAEIAVSVAAPSGALIWTAIIATTATGISSACSVAVCKKLALCGWTSSATLAHRFYLTIAVALAWLATESAAIPVLPASTLAVVMMVGAVVILIPLLLLQIALRRTDELTVMICLRRSRSCHS